MERIMTNVHAVDKSTWQQIAAHARDVRERFRELRIIITKDAVKISTTVLDEGGKALKADIDTVVSIIHEALKSRVSIEEAILSYIEKQPYGEEARKYILNPYKDIINELSYRLWEEGGRQHNRVRLLAERAKGVLGDDARRICENVAARRGNS
jgi:hypothetical protein